MTPDSNLDKVDPFDVLSDLAVALVDSQLGQRTVPGFQPVTPCQSVARMHYNKTTKLTLLDSLLQERMSSDDGIVYIPKYIMTIETFV